MISSKRVISGIGLGLLLLLVVFTFLANRPIPPPPSAPPPVLPIATVGSIRSTAISTVITTDHHVATPQVALVATPAASPPSINTPVNATASIASTTSHNNWLSFGDKQAGYSIRYPANLFVQSGKHRDKMYNMLTLALGGEQGMSIQIEPNLHHLSIDKFLEGRLETSAEKRPDAPISTLLAEIKVAGLSAYQLNYQRADYFDLYGGEIYILLPYGDKIYIFSVGGYGHGGAMLSSEGETLFFQILDTFQINP